MQAVNQTICYDIGYNIDRVTSEPYLFVLDEDGLEVERFPFGVPERGSYACPDVEVEVIAWCRQRGATRNKLPSYKQWSIQRRTI